MESLGQRRPDIMVYSATLRELTRQETAEFLLAERVRYEIDSTDWDDKRKHKAHQALELALYCHSGDTRDDKPYVTHVLRVAARIMSCDHFAIRDNPQIVIAALLHDVIEDRPETLLDELPLDHTDKSPAALAMLRDQQHRALLVVKEMFGPETTKDIKRVSNEVHDDTGTLSQIQKHHRYQAKVRQVFEQGGHPAIIKLSDFVDNCVGLKHNPDPRKRFKLAQKYQPLIPTVRDYVISSQLGQEYKQHLLDELAAADSYCSELIASAGLAQPLGLHAA